MCICHFEKGIIFYLTKDTVPKQLLGDKDFRRILGLSKSHHFLPKL